MADDLVTRLRAKVTVRKWGYRTTDQLLAKAARDSDEVSMFVDGVNWQSAAGAIFVVKDASIAEVIYDEFVERGWITQGKPVVDRKARRNDAPD